MEVKNFENELEVSASGGRISSQPDTITTKECLQMYCRVTYQLRKVKNKGAILVLVWSFLVSSLANYLINTVLQSYHTFGMNSVLAIIAVMLPAAGWLADVRFGRYKIIRCSIWTMWISCMLLTVTNVVFSLVDFNDSKIHSIPIILLKIVMGFGLGGFQAVIVQFGVDQLNDASTTEITSFVAWYAWTLISSNVTAIFINMLTCIDSKYNLMGQLLITVCLTLVVCTNYLFSSHLIKEPVTQNPFKLIYKVVRYAIKTKHLRRRSAFTYWEDDPPSRMDFGKIKYGGPFTTEQVEDVKTFISTFGIILIASVLASMDFNFHINDFYTTYITKLFGKHHTENHFYYCFGNGKNFLTNIDTIFGLFLVPLNEFLIYPLLNRCVVIRIHWKILLGTLFQLVGLIVLITLISYGRLQYIETNALPHNYTLQCLFHENSNSLTNDVIDYRWFVLVEFLLYVSSMMLTIGIIEFYCAQVPYTMKGLMAGIFYACLELCVMFNYGLLRLFRRKSHIWESNTTFNCGFWYLLTKIILVAITALILMLSIKYHKKRKREDVLPNEHIFAEQYYSVQ